MLDSAEEQQVLQMNLLCSKAAGIVFRAVINTSLWMAKQTLQGTQAPGKEPHGESHFKRESSCNANNHPSPKALPSCPELTASLQRRGRGSHLQRRQLPSGVRRPGVLGSTLTHCTQAQSINTVLCSDLQVISL